MIYPGPHICWFLGYIVYQHIPPVKWCILVHIFAGPWDTSITSKFLLINDVSRSTYLLVLRIHRLPVYSSWQMMYPGPYIYWSLGYIMYQQISHDKWYILVHIFAGSWDTSFTSKFLLINDVSWSIYLLVLGIYQLPLNLFHTWYILNLIFTSCEDASIISKIFVINYISMFICSLAI